MDKKERFRIISEMGCIICGAPCEIHHLIGLQYGQSMGKKAPDNMTIGLCPMHHRLGEFGHSVHNGTKAFEENYGTQGELLEKQNKLIDLY